MPSCAATRPRSPCMDALALPTTRCCLVSTAAAYCWFCAAPGGRHGLLHGAGLLLHREASGFPAGCWPGLQCGRRICALAEDACVAREKRRPPPQRTSPITARKLTCTCHVAHQRRQHMRVRPIMVDLGLRRQRSGKIIHLVDHARPRFGKSRPARPRSHGRATPLRRHGSPPRHASARRRPVANTPTRPNASRWVRDSRCGGPKVSRQPRGRTRPACSLKVVAAGALCATWHAAAPRPQPLVRGWARSAPTCSPRVCRCRGWA